MLQYAHYSISTTLPKSGACDKYVTSCRDSDAYLYEITPTLLLGTEKNLERSCSSLFTSYLFSVPFIVVIEFNNISYFFL